MPPRTIRCRQIRQQGGKIFVRWSDKSENEFESRAGIRQFIRQQLTEDVLKALLLAAVLEDAADGTPLSQCDGKRITLDWAASPMLTISEQA